MSKEINLRTQMQNLNEAMERYSKENNVNYLDFKYYINDNGEKYIINSSIPWNKQVEIYINGNKVDVHYVMEGSKHHSGTLTETEINDLEKKIFRGFITWIEDGRN